MVVPKEVKAMLPAYGSLEGVADAEKLCSAKLMTLTGETTVYLLEGSVIEGEWLFLILRTFPQNLKPISQRHYFAAEFEQKLESLRDSFGNQLMLDPYFIPAAVSSVVNFDKT